MTRRKADLIAGIVCVLIASIFWIQGSKLEPDSNLFPKVLEICMIVGGFACIGKSLLSKNKQDDLPDEAEKLDWVKAIVIIVASIIYIFGMVYVGFYVTTLVYLTLGSWYLNDEDRSSLKAIVGSIVFGVGVSVVLYLTFNVFLQVPTPNSLLI